MPSFNKNNDFEALSAVTQTLLSAPNSPHLLQEVVDAVLLQIKNLSNRYHVTALALLDKKEKTLKRIVYSNTSTGNTITSKFIKDNKDPIKFSDIVTPLSAHKNLCVRALKERKIFLTHSYADILSPPIDLEQCQILQKTGGIKTSVVFPIIVKNVEVGVLIFSTKKNFHHLPSKEKILIESLTGIVGIAIENSKLFSQINQDKKDLLAANRRLKEVDDLKNDFVSIASHELRTPMTAIKNYLWLIFNDINLDADKRKEFVKIAYDSSERLINMVNDMLTISRIEDNRLVMNKTVFDIRVLINKVKEELNSVAVNKGLDFITENDQEVLAVKGDQEKIYEVLQNLVSNALKFTTTGSITLQAHKKNDEVIIKVIDTGVGISKVDQNKIFTKFTRLEKTYTKIRESGTGLGLYIVKEILHYHQGHIELESEVGKGSTFTVVIPYSKEPITNINISTLTTKKPFLP